MPTRKGVEARNGLNSAPLRRAVPGRDPGRYLTYRPGGRYLKYRPRLGAYKSLDPSCAVQICSIATLNSVFLITLKRKTVSSSPVARRRRWSGGSGEAATCPLRRRWWPAIEVSDVLAELLHLLGLPATLVPHPVPRGGCAAISSGDQKLLELELARQARPQSSDLAVLLLLRGVWSSLSGSELRRRRCDPGHTLQQQDGAMAVRRFRRGSNV